MSIVTALGHTVQAYLKHYSKKPPRIPLYCGRCDDRLLHHHGRYRREAVSRRRAWLLPIYRWLCPECGGTVSLLPDFLRPYARFVSFMREKAVWRHLQGHTLAAVAHMVSSPAVSVVSERTLARWVHRARDWVRERGAEPAARLLEANPALDLRPLEKVSGDPLQYLGLVGRQLQLQTELPAGEAGRGHPGLFAFLNRLLGGPIFL